MAPPRLKPRPSNFPVPSRRLAAIAPGWSHCKHESRHCLHKPRRPTHRHATTRIAQSAIVARIEDAKTVVGFSKALATVDVSRTAATTAEAELASARQSLAQFQAEIDRTNQNFATTQQAASAATAAVEATRKQQADKQSTLDAVKEALSKTELAQQKLPTRPGAGSSRSVTQDQAGRARRGDENG